MRRWIRACNMLSGALLVMAALVTSLGVPLAQDGDDAEQVFHDHISDPVVQAKCVNCHVQGGVSGHTRLVLVPSSADMDYRQTNLRTFATLVDDLADEGGVSYILNKIQGVQHGGGVQVAAGSADFANMQRFLGLLSGVGAMADVPPQSSKTDAVRLAPTRRTLRRAALIYAGRNPTDAEYAAVQGGDKAALRSTIRDLMTGPEFHGFLLRGSNDRLLTDGIGWVINPTAHFPDFANQEYDHKKSARAKGNEREYRKWIDRVQYGFGRAPLELIAYVVENDKPYTEILTADYIMANSWAARAYGAPTYFRDPDNVHEFRPSRIVQYYGEDDSVEAEYDPIIDAHRVFDPGRLSMRYPHAGVLNTTVFLKRYPTTPTNRNRARSRWTYYHFLGLDVEKSASRTTDPVALADTNNPTMHNPNCTVCHSVLDPVAGAFQNYGDEGLYKHRWGGMDSLDDAYRGGDGPTLPVQADTWADREVLVWPVSLGDGVQTLTVMYTNHFWDEAAQEGGRVFLDRLDVVDGDGQVVSRVQFEHLPAPVAHWGNCGEAQRTGRGGNDHFHLWSGYEECAFFVDVDVPSPGAYDVEVVAWSTGPDNRYRSRNVQYAELSVVANGYQEGDVWYRDMRTPGFAGTAAPSSDNSVQWLAQRIAADPRFAEATVKFWWPAIMGSEVAEFPEEASDAGFAERLRTASGQDTEVRRLAAGFRRGFHGGAAYNLKDLLVEMVLTPWFRDARRLLTAEELANKTAAVTGVQWGREYAWNRPGYSGSFHELTKSEWRLFYGGIDSEGITERQRDITATMAGVAKLHAVRVGCATVLRELYLLPDGQRQLFAGIEPTERSAVAVKAKLAELHDKLLGVQVTPGSLDVEAAYRLFVEVSTHGQQAGEDWFQWWHCNTVRDRRFWVGILDDAVIQRVDDRGERWHDLDWDRIEEFMDDIDLSDPYHTGQAWVVVLTGMLMDYRYLYL